MKKLRRKTAAQAKELTEKIRHGGGWADWYAIYSQNGHNTILYCIVEITSSPRREIAFEIDPKTGETREKV